MKKEYRVFFVLIAWIISMLACANPVIGTAPETTNVETVVAATFNALTAPTPEISAMPPPLTDSLLPHSLYFLSNDAAGLAQVYRVEKDGTSIKQITFEPANVDFYDVSLMDGSVAYVSNNQLLTVNAGGGNRAMILDGGPRDENNPVITNISNPVFSPNGETIAFGYKGLNFYSIASGQYNNVLENQYDTLNDGFIIPREAYWPEKYSADGSKLIITLAYYEGASAAIYYPNGNALVRLTGGDGALICCGETEWSIDGSVFYAGNPSLGMFSPGLWRVDSANGAVTTLINGDSGDGTFSFADAPYLAPDGQLYYFFATQSVTDEFLNRVPLQLVRSGADGVTNRTILRAETFENMNEALWAPDASFVIAAIGQIPEVYQGGAVFLIYTEGQSTITLLPFAMDMKWGP